jgi:hypothetical protein
MSHFEEITITGRPQPIADEQETEPIRFGSEEAKTAVWFPRLVECRCCGEGHEGDRFCPFCGRESSRVIPGR